MKLLFQVNQIPRAYKKRLSKACFQEPYPAKARSCTRVHAEVPVGEANPTAPGIRAAAIVDQVYGDADDENMPFHRWLDAKEGIARSGLSPSHESSGFSATAGRELTYGEFDLLFFCELLELAMLLRGESAGQIFVDIGSGYGRIVACAAELLGGDWRCRGVEIVPRMAEVAQSTIDSDDNFRRAQWTERITLINGDYRKKPTIFSGASICFCFATTWPHLDELADAIALYASQGAIIITVDKPLPPRVCFAKAAEPVERRNEATGVSTAHLYRLTR